jgi:hypothetical protein
MRLKKSLLCQLSILLLLSDRTSWHQLSSVNLLKRSSRPIFKPSLLCTERTISTTLSMRVTLPCLSSSSYLGLSHPILDIQKTLTKRRFTITHTDGVASDPLTQLAVVFSALVHDVDHQGVANTQLVKENAVIAAVYQNKSVAEQNSVDIAWSLLMDESFTELRRVIYTTESEFRRFRQLVVNAVMATDIVDKDLGNARKVRWEKAFSEGATDDSEITNVNRKATIVIEHLIQASDVAHTMQQWHIYRQWNMRLFEEMSRAYRSGRAGMDPAEKWYENEIGFFDFYIIPFAKKLKDCGVFGVSSDGYLNYALMNRREWEVKGKEIVAGRVEALDASKDIGFTAS